MILKKRYEAYSSLYDRYAYPGKNKKNCRGHRGRIIAVSYTHLTLPTTPYV